MADAKDGIADLSSFELIVSDTLCCLGIGSLLIVLDEGTSFMHSSFCVVVLLFLVWSAVGVNPAFMAQP